MGNFLWECASRLQADASKNQLDALKKSAKMRYLIFLRTRVGGGRFIAYYDSGFFHFTDESGCRLVHSKDVKRSYLYTKPHWYPNGPSRNQGFC